MPRPLFPSISSPPDNLDDLPLSGRDQVTSLRIGGPGPGF